MFSAHTIIFMFNSNVYAEMCYYVDLYIYYYSAPYIFVILQKLHARKLRVLFLLDFLFYTAFYRGYISSD